MRNLSTRTDHNGSPVLDGCLHRIDRGRTILGSNIFNTYVVLGAGSLVAGALTVPTEIPSFAVPDWWR